MASASLTQISSANVSYSHIAHLSADELNQLAESFFIGFNQPGNKLDYTPTTRGVTLYRICYVIETDARNGPQAVSGLLAIPDDPATPSDAPRELPLAMYNHGTVFDRRAVPSEVVLKDSNGAWQVGSFETFLDLCRLSDAGYALIAADYVGEGINTSQEGYSVREVSNAAMLGMIEASRSILADLNVNPGQLFLNGWSQGALNTQFITQKLETLAIPVAASAVAAPMNNWLGSFAWSYSLDLLKQEAAAGEPGVNPDDPAPWLPLAMGLAIASYEHWYELDGLFDSMLRDKIIPDRQFDASGNIIDDPETYTYTNNPKGLTYREVIRNFTKNYSTVPYDSNFSNILWKVLVPQSSAQEGSPIFEETTVPGFTVKEMLIEGIFEAPQNDLVSGFLRQLRNNSVQYWNYTTPLQAWYGDNDGDEALPSDLVDPDMAIFGGSKVSLVPVANGSHREAFLNMLYASPDNPGGTDQNLIDWFNGFRKQAAAPAALQLADNTLQVVSDDFGLLPVLLEATQQQGERPLHIQILRLRNDGSSEIIGSLGGTTAVAGQLQSLGSERVLLQVGERLGFQLLSRSGNAIDTSTTEIRAREGGAGFEVTLRDGSGPQAASLQFRVDAAPQQFTPSLLDRLAAPQAAAADGLLQLRAGQVLNLAITSDSAFTNTLGFVRLNRDPITGLPLSSVGEQAIDINSDTFRSQIDSLLDPGFQFSQGGRTISSTLEWTVAQDGIYAAVLITPEGNVFCAAPGSSDQQMRRLGQNRLGFEDLKGTVSDYDWNDLVVDITGVSIGLG